MPKDLNVVLLIFPKAVSQYFMGFADDEKRGGIDLLNSTLKSNDLPLLKGYQQAPSPWRMVTPRSISWIMASVIAWYLSLMI